MRPAISPVPIVTKAPLTHIPSRSRVPPADEGFHLWSSPAGRPARWSFREGNAAMDGDATFSLANDQGGARRAAEALFASARRDLVPILPASAEVLHVGATAIPGCLTKGDLDVAVRVDADDFPSVEATLAARFPRNAGSIRTTDFAAFADAGASPALGIQVTTRGGDFDVFHCFAAALRADSTLVAGYNALKIRCEGAPMDAYRAAKDVFIADVLRSRFL